MHVRASKTELMKFILATTHITYLADIRVLNIIKLFYYTARFNVSDHMIFFK